MLYRASSETPLTNLISVIVATSSRGFLFIHGLDSVKSGVLTTYINHPGEIACINIKQLNLTLWEREPLQTISTSARETQKRRKIPLPQIPARIFWSFPNGMGRTIWFSYWNFQFSHVNGKYPRLRQKLFRRHRLLDLVCWKGYTSHVLQRSNHRC